MPQITPVLLLSTQTLPNVLFLKELVAKGVQVQQLIMLSTQRMKAEGRGEWVLQASGLKGKVEVQEIEIAAEDYRQAKIDLQQHQHDPKAYYFLNLTGGTKTMAMAAYDFYRAQADCRAFYMPIGGQFIQRIYPDHEEVAITTQLGLKDYLAAYGCYIEEQGELLGSKQETESIAKELMQKGTPLQTKGLNTALAMDGKDPKRNYYMGAWFEEWTYHFFKTHFNLQQTQIAFNCKLKWKQSKNSSEADNELDLLFVHQNQLHIIECKCYVNDNLTATKITQPMYKLGAIQRNLGLHAHCYLLIANELGEDPQRYKRIALLEKLLRIRKVLGLKELSKFPEFFK